jgi:hypothetical protein
MTRKNILTLSLAVIFVICAGTSAMATITGISSDGCAGTTCQPSFVSPIVAGKQMTVTVKGQFVDLSTRVEISGSGVSVSYGDRAGGSNSFIVVRFNVDDSASLGERTVRLRYAIETNGPDTFHVKVVRGGRVDKIEQKVPGLLVGTTRLVAPDTIPVNQRVTLVFTGARLGHAEIAPILAVRNPQTLSGCSETRCEVQLEFTQSGIRNVNLFDGDVPANGNNLLYKFFYGGAEKVTVVGASSSSTTGNVIPRIPSSSISTPTTFIDVAPRANILNVFRRTGNSITVNGQNFLPVEDRWCTEAGVQIPSSGSASQPFTVPDITWGASNVGTAEVPVAFDSQLLSNNQVLDTRNIAVGTLHPGGTHDFKFHRQRSSVRVIRFAPPNQAGCFVNPHDTDFFEDPPFTVKVDVGNAVPETATNRLNNARNY